MALMMGRTCAEPATRNEVDPSTRAQPTERHSIPLTKAPTNRTPRPLVRDVSCAPSSMLSRRMVKTDGEAWMSWRSGQEDGGMGCFGVAPADLKVMEETQDPE